jgi:hypothetical protein
MVGGGGVVVAVMVGVVLVCASSATNLATGLADAQCTRYIACMGLFGLLAGVAAAVWAVSGVAEVWSNVFSAICPACPTGPGSYPVMNFSNAPRLCIAMVA